MVMKTWILKLSTHVCMPGTHRISEAQHSTRNSWRMLDRGCTYKVAASLWTQGGAVGSASCFAAWKVEAFCLFHRLGHFSYSDRTSGMSTKTETRKWRFPGASLFYFHKGKINSVTFKKNGNPLKLLISILPGSVRGSASMNEVVPLTHSRRVQGREW